MTDIYIGSSSTNTYDISSFGQTIVDSGTSQIALPSKIFTSIANTIGSNANFNTIFPSANGAAFFTSSQCLTTTYTVAQINSMLPTMTLALCIDSSCTQAYRFTLNSVSSYLQLLITQDSTGTVTNNYCTGIGSLSSTETILGIAFINQFTSIFDIENSQIGFVPTANCPELSVTAPVEPYMWSVTQWSPCGGPCSNANSCNTGTSTQNRQVICVDSTGIEYPDSSCASTSTATSGGLFGTGLLARSYVSGSKPVTTQSCSGGAYHGQYDSNNPCSTISCGGSNQGFCQAGICLCINGWAGTTCQSPPHITVTQVQYTAPSTLTIEYDAVGQFITSAIYVAPAGYNISTSPLTQSQPQAIWPLYLNRAYPMDVSGASASYSNTSLIVPTGMHTAGIAYSPQLSSSMYNLTIGSTRTNCSSICTYGGYLTSSSDTCQCLCPGYNTNPPQPAANTAHYNCSICSLSCTSPAQPDSQCTLCTGCPAVSSTLLRVTGTACNIPYSAINMTLDNIAIANLTGNNLLSFQSSLVSDIAYAIGIPSTQLIYQSFVPQRDITGPTASINSINVRLYILGLAGDSSNDNVDGYAYTYINHATPLLSQGLVSSYSVSLSADSAAPPSSLSGRARALLNEAAAWIVGHWQPLLEGLLGGLGGLLIVYIIYRMCTKSNTNDKQVKVKKHKLPVHNNIAKPLSPQQQQQRIQQYNSNQPPPPYTNVPPPQAVRLQNGQIAYIAQPQQLQQVMPQVSHQQPQHVQSIPPTLQPSHPPIQRSPQYSIVQQQHNQPRNPMQG